MYLHRIVSLATSMCFDIKLLSLRRLSTYILRHRVERKVFHIVARLRFAFFTYIPAHYFSL